MHICFASLDYPTASSGGGVGHYVRTLGRELLRRGHRVSVIALQNGNRPTMFSDAGIEIWTVQPGNCHWYVSKLPVLGRLFSLPIRELEYSKAVLDAARRIDAANRIDVLEGIETGAVWLDRLRPGLNTVIRLHGERYTFEKHTPPGSIPLDVRLSRLLQRWALRKAAKLTAPSLQHASEVHQELHERISLPEVIPNPVDLDEQGEVAHRCDHQRPLFLFVGRLQRVKGVIPFLEAIPLVLEKLPNARFVLAGSPHPSIPRGEIERILQDNGAGSMTTLCGHFVKDELQELYRSATVVVIPSYYESFGYVCLEALGHGVPVVATHTGIAPEVVRDGENGCLVPSGDARALAVASLQALQVPAGGKGGGFLEKFAPARVADQMELVYRDLAS